MTASNDGSVLKGNMHQQCSLTECIKLSVYIYTLIQCFIVPADVVAYVDVWSSDKSANYSKVFIEQLQEMGAQVNILLHYTFYRIYRK